MGREHSAHRKKEEAVCDEQTASVYVGDDLLSHALSRAVQSARRGLTSVFAMGTGISHGGWPAYNLPGAYANYFKNALDPTNAGSLTARKIEASGRLGSTGPRGKCDFCPTVPYRFWPELTLRSGQMGPFA